MKPSAPTHPGDHPIRSEHRAEDRSGCRLHPQLQRDLGACVDGDFAEHRTDLADLDDRLHPVAAHLQVEVVSTVDADGQAADGVGGSDGRLRLGVQVLLTSPDERKIIRRRVFARRGQQPRAVVMSENVGRKASWAHPGQRQSLGRRAARQ